MRNLTMNEIELVSGGEIDLNAAGFFLIANNVSGEVFVRNPRYENAQFVVSTPILSSGPAGPSKVPSKSKK